MKRLAAIVGLVGMLSVAAVTRSWARTQAGEPDEPGNGNQVAVVGVGDPDLPNTGRLAARRQSRSLGGPDCPWTGTSLSGSRGSLRSSGEPDVPGNGVACTGRALGDPDMPSTRYSPLHMGDPDYPTNSAIHMCPGDPDVPIGGASTAWVRTAIDWVSDYLRRAIGNLGNRIN